jgi:heme-degrading monooxygenase HmoA
MMYGTVARFRVRADVEKEEFKRKMDEFDSSRIPGWVADYIFQMDSDSDEFYLVAVFKDKESYQANADDPKQHERYLIFRSYLEADPEWHDGMIVSATGPGAR